MWAGIRRWQLFLTAGKSFPTQRRPAKSFLSPENSARSLHVVSDSPSVAQDRDVLKWRYEVRGNK